MATTTKTAPDQGSAPSAADIEKQIDRLKADMAGLTSSIAALGAGKARGAKSEAEARLAEIAGSGEAALDDLRARLKDHQAQLADTVRRRPVASLGVAVGVGVLLALLLRR